MAIFNVATNAELTSALSSASDGDEIVGAAGASLGNLTKSGANFGAYVRITSADLNNKCTLTRLDLSNCSYIDIDGVALSYTFQSGHSASYRPFRITGSHHMKLRNCVNTGGMGAGGYGTGEGFFWQNVDDFVEEDNYTTGYRKSDNHVTCNRGSIRRNEFYNIRLDAMSFAEVQDLDIENNYIHDHRADPNNTEHRDGIQFHSNNKTIPCKRINIRQNRIDLGDGDWSQGILVRNEAVVDQGGGIGLRYEDFLIEENLIYGRHHHGITLESCHNGTIRKNTVVMGKDNKALAHNQNRTNNTEEPDINIGGSFLSNITISDNVCAAITDHGNGATKTNNRLIDPKTTTYDADFENIKSVSGTQASPVANDWTVKPGGLVDSMAAGVTDMTAAGTGGGSVPAAMQPPTLEATNVPVNIAVN